ncbi:MAG TPA: entericidin A/B family lipoprotein [Tepidisphaeraceae bacterium]|nr:entericidin A/B family lipoprotein [Tepidisphaeraceae bacterium]
MLSFKSIIRLALVAIVAGVGLTQSLACNTTEGAGKDLERAGEKIQDAAN